MGKATRQAGAITGILVMAIVLALLAVLIARALSRVDVQLDQEQRTRASFERIRQAITQFVVLNQRLPCPALGTDDTGTAAPAGAAVSCTDDAGVVPWSTLAIRREDAVDGWGRKISYRVFDGAAGFTQAGGASLTDCNSSIGAPYGSIAASGQCEATLHVNTPAQSIAARGSMLTVNNLGTAQAQLAFVLISHGSSGYGGYAAEGTGRGDLPPSGSPPASGSEYANTQAGSTFYVVAPSDASIATTDPSHFDDVLAYGRFDDVVAAAKLSARAWSATPGQVAGQGFGRSALMPYLPDVNAVSTDQTSITMGTGAGQFTVTASGSAAREVSAGIGASGEGIGAIGATLANDMTSMPYATANSASSEALLFEFATPARYLGIQLVDFGTASGSPERVLFTFYLASVQVGSTITKTACATGDVLANYTLTPTAISDFDAVKVQPLVNVAGTADSQLLVGSLATCQAGANLCRAPGSNPANDCP